MYGSRNSFGEDKAILSVKYLHPLNTCQLSSVDIYRIFQSCGALKEIKVNNSLFVTPVTHGPYQTTYKCLEHLQHCKDSLEILD
jgi:hypothetical protein